MKTILLCSRPSAWRAQAALALCSAVIQASAAAAEPADPVVLDRVVVDAAVQAGGTSLTRIATEVSRPLSTLTPQAIEQLATFTSDFGTLANLLPSFVSSAPNGNGFDAAKSMTLRGFPDGQFNVMLDGIPFADPDVFTHHSTSIFPASSIESLQVDRSPGGGTTLGYATIGGSLDIESLALPATGGAELYGSYGSFATRLLGVRLNTARPAEDGQTGLLANVQHMQTDGALANNHGRRDDLLLKSESLWGGLRLTLLYTYDDYHFINPPSVTTDQIASSGSGVGLGTTPGTPLYNDYAKTDRSADFGYARLRGELGDRVAFTDTVYTFSYDNAGLSVNGDVTLPSSYQVGKGFAGVTATDIAGRYSTNRYRTVGNILQLERALGTHLVRGGLWLEHSHQVATRNARDLTTGVPYAANKAAQSSALYDYEATLDTVQPFVEDEWKATPALTVKPGLRYQSAKRGFTAIVVPNSRPGTPEVDRSVNTALPSLEGNYAFTPQTHGYAQWARGALVPSQAFFYTNNPALGNQAAPQTSQAWQAGVVHADGPVSWNVDGYLIDLKNYVTTTTDANKNTVFLNNGRVRYRGIEAEGNASLGLGLTAVANASLIRAQFRDPGLVNPVQQTGDTIPLAPRYTALAGVLYRHGPWSGSLMAKWIGAEYQGSGGSSDGMDRRVGPYSYTNATVSRRLDDWLGGHGSSVTLAVNNVFDQTPITDSAGRSAAGPTGPLLVNVLPRRNFMLSFRYDL